MVPQIGHGGKDMTGPLDGERAEAAIPVLARRFGSWRISVEREPFGAVEIGRRYDRAAPRWGRIIERLGFRDAYEALLRSAIDVQALTPAGARLRVLDCGVGTGALSAALGRALPTGLDLYGIDLSARMLERARVNLNAQGLDVALRQADMRALPFRDGAFDVVMSAHALEHAARPAAALAEMVRVLAHGGLLVCCMTRRSLLGAIVQLKHRTHLVTEAEAERWLSDAGLEDVRSLRLGKEPLCNGLSIACSGRKTDSSRSAVSHRRAPRHDVIVIGAGMSGLAVAYRLKRQGIRAVTLDQTQRIAEPWRRRHEQLRLNTHRHLSRLPGLALPQSAGAFASREAVIEYLEEYRRRMNLAVEHGVRVHRLDRCGSGWEAQTSCGPLRARHVIVATGRDRVPVMPAWPGTERFGGQIIHAADFGRLEAYRDRRILVVGGGNSGVDVLNHLVRIPTRELWVSIRRGTAVIPTRLGGFPVQRSAAWIGRLPTPIVDALLGATERLAFGDLERLGLPRPREGAATRLVRDGIAPAIDDGFVAALEAGRVTPVVAVARFDDSRAMLTDGTELEPDVVICATGYRPGLGRMLGHLGILGERGFPRPPEHRVYAAVPGLWLMGMWPRLQGNFYAVRSESRRIAARVGAALAA
jgi:cation diffusion facilitator CzcD-associated flavoprotein CzcO/ubiquinone/menaquinone biosynthesis C-methylase UbiE